MWRGKSDPVMLVILVGPIALDEAGAWSAPSGVVDHSTRKGLSRSILGDRRFVRPNRRRPRRRERYRPRLHSEPEALLHALAGVADLLDGLLHRRRRPSGLLRLIPHFVVLPPATRARSCFLPRAVFFFAAAIRSSCLAGCCSNAAKDSPVPCRNVLNRASLNRPVRSRVL
jgi:hypothetical protein